MFGVKRRDLIEKKMDLKALKLQMVRGPLLLRLVLKGFLFATAMIVLAFTHLAHDARSVEPFMLNHNECPITFGLKTAMNFTGLPKPLSAFSFPLFGGSALKCEESKNLSKNVFSELIERGLLRTNSKALCVGDGSGTAVLALRELDVPNAIGVNRHPFFSLMRRRFVYELGFEDDHFDFVFSRALDRVSVPALLVHEIERVLRPGGIGAMLVGPRSRYSASLIRLATPLALFLKNSDVVHICGIGPFSLVIFKKRLRMVTSFDHFQLPQDCPSIVNYRPYMKYIEPLINGNSEHLGRQVSHLPSLMNIASRERLIYINIGANDFATLNVPNLVKLYNPIPPQAFNLFIVDHNTSILSSHITNPFTTFVYHPGLSESNAALEINPDYYLSPLDEGDFDFASWFKETVEDGDFVVLRMAARAVELNILKELFETGAICRVDEMFLHCSDHPAGCEGESCMDCMSIFKSLRKSGLFVHQWTGD